VSLPWTAADYARDASDLTAEATDAALGEVYAGRDDWHTPPSAADVARDEEWGERYWRERERGDEWWSA
jgi:hypothetical protein